MRILSYLCYIASFIAGILLVLLPTISTWIVVFDSTVGGILFSIFLFPIAILGYPIMILVGGLATGLGGTISVAAAIIGYITIAFTVGLWVLAGWLSEKADENASQKQWLKEQMSGGYRNQKQSTLSENKPFIGNANNKIVHCADCILTSTIQPGRSISFDSYSDASELGFKPCNTCQPELRSLSDSMNLTR
jgi:hypothetical protein